MPATPDEQRRDALVKMFGGEVEPERPADDAKPGEQRPQLTIEQMMLAQSAEREQRRWFGEPSPPTEAPEPEDEAVNFDGGARESVPQKGDPGAEHAQLLAELFAQGRGWGGW